MPFVIEISDGEDLVIGRRLRHHDPLERVAGGRQRDRVIEHGRGVRELVARDDVSLPSLFMSASATARAPFPEGKSATVRFPSALLVTTLTMLALRPATTRSRWPSRSCRRRRLPRGEDATATTGLAVQPVAPRYRICATLLPVDAIARSGRPSRSKSPVVTTFQP